MRRFNRSFSISSRFADRPIGSRSRRAVPRFAALWLLLFSIASNGISRLAGSCEEGGTATVVPVDSFSFPASGVRVKGRAILHAIDDLYLPLKKNLCYYLSKPNVRT